MRINLTGFTGAHVRGNNKKNVIGFSNLLKKLLTDQGHEADYGLENPDIHIVCVLDLSSINSSNAVECLKLLRKDGDKCFIAFDDWNIRGFYKTLDGILETKKFSKTHHTVDYVGVLEHLDIIKKLADGDYKVLYPAYKTGDHELLGIRGEKFCVDPSIYIEKEWPSDIQPGELIPVHASLAGKWSLLSKKKYSLINLRGESEDTVFKYYIMHGIVMTPPHYHDGSGWFRNRYSLAYLANAVVIEDDSGVFGDSYRVERKAVNERTVDKILDEQRSAYEDTIMSKKEIAEVLKEAFGEATT